MDLKIPEHVAIIMDGNGRWAKQRNLPRRYGHKKGAERVEEIVEASLDFGIRVLTLYAFSTENWLRPKEEVKFLMKLLKEYIKNQIKKLIEKNVRLNFIGNFSKFSDDIRDLIKYSMNETAHCEKLLLNIALNYGGRSEIVNATKQIALNVKNGVLSIDEIDKELFSNYLYTRGIKDPDLLIRTSGEYRISNFLLWQIAYTELYITDTYWPDFDRNEFKKAIEDYGKRERRFGKISEQINS